MSRLLNGKEVRAKLKGYIAENFSTSLNFAESQGVTGSYVSAVLTGKKEIPAKWLELIGYEKQKQVLYKSK
jgi:hypothetical protein